jgi:hypothetical protein
MYNPSPQQIATMLADMTQLDEYFEVQESAPEDNFFYMTHEDTGKKYKVLITEEEL